jgi:hypothetical protein
MDSFFLLLCASQYCVQHPFRVENFLSVLFPRAVLQGVVVNFEAWMGEYRWRIERSGEDHSPGPKHRTNPNKTMNQIEASWCIPCEHMPRVPIVRPHPRFQMHPRPHPRVPASQLPCPTTEELPYRTHSWTRHLPRDRKYCADDSQSQPGVPAVCRSEEKASCCGGPCVPLKMG